jgi:hypothetical protein
LHTPAELEDDSAYRQVSPMAVIALILGLASLVAFIGSAFFLIPIAAIGAALLALGRINRSGGALTGRNLAHVAIALALFCTVASLVRDSVRDSLLNRQAVDAGQKWLTMLADGQIKEALGLLTGDAAASLVPRPEMGQPPLPEEVSKSLAEDHLRSDSLSRALNGRSQAPTLESVAEPLFDGAKTIVPVTFTFTDPDKSDRRKIQLQMVRSAYYESLGKPWRVERWSLDAPESAPPEP